MSSSRAFPDNQTWLSSVMAMRGFSRSVLSNGICRGVAHEGRSVIMADDLPTFNTTLTVLHTLFAQNQTDAGSSPNTSTTDLGEADALLKRIDLVSQWFLYRSQLPRNGYDVLARKQRLYALTTRPSLMGDRGIIDVCQLFGVYARRELSSLVSILRACVVNRKEIVDPVTYFIEANGHDITIGYIPERKQWHVIDSNRLRFQDIHSDEEFIATMLPIFFNNETTAFDITISTTVRQIANIKAAIFSMRTQPVWQALQDVKVQAKRIDDRGITCLYLAAASGDENSVIEHIASEADVKQPTKDKNELPLHMAALNGFHHVVSRLLTADKTIINARRLPDKMTPLGLAAQNGDKQTVLVLLNNGANVNDRFDDDATSLFHAACNGHDDAIEVLLDWGAEIDAATNSEGTTSLIMCATKGHRSTAQLLLDRHADPNFKNKQGYTALHFAAKAGHADLVQLLLDKGADSTIAVKGYTAQDIAKSRRHTEVVKVFENHASRCIIIPRQDHDRSPTSMPEGSQNANAVCKPFNR